MVGTVTPAWPRKKILGGKEGQFTRIFHLEKEGREKVQVCQKNISRNSWSNRRQSYMDCFNKDHNLQND